MTDTTDPREAAEFDSLPIEQGVTADRIEDDTLIETVAASPELEAKFEQLLADGAMYDDALLGLGKDAVIALGLLCGLSEEECPQVLAGDHVAHPLGGWL